MAAQPNIVDAPALMPALVDKVRRVVRSKAFGLDADDHEDIVQDVLIDVWERKPFMALPENEGALVQHIRFVVLRAVRSAKRHTTRGALLGGRFTSLEDMKCEPWY